MKIPSPSDNGSYTTVYDLIGKVLGRPFKSFLLRPIFGLSARTSNALMILPTTASAMAGELSCAM
jgi:hypothetical protein